MIGKILVHLVKILGLSAHANLLALLVKICSYFTAGVIQHCKNPMFIFSTFIQRLIAFVISICKNMSWFFIMLSKVIKLHLLPQVTDTWYKRRVVLGLVNEFCVDFAIRFG